MSQQHFRTGSWYISISLLIKTPLIRTRTELAAPVERLIAVPEAFLGRVLLFDTPSTALAVGHRIRASLCLCHTSHEPIY